ncbi:MAG: 50S ribosomal protein L24 [Candidatus Acidiferrales bacterium]
MKNRFVQTPSAAGLRKGDQVRVMAGRDKGKEGRVLFVDARRRRVTVEHANMIKRATRADSSKNIKGGVVEREASIDISNVMIVCPSCNKHARIGRKEMPDGTTVRVCRRCGTTLEK